MMVSWWKKRSAFRWAGMVLGISLACDGFLGGPVWRGLRELVFPEPRDGVAVVAGRWITEGQVERALRERLWREARSVEGMTREGLAEARRALLEELIDGELLRGKAEAAGIVVGEKELEERWKRYVARFSSEEEMVSAAKGQGIGGAAELRERLAGLMRQEKYLETRIGPAAEVGEEEARKWFEENGKRLEIPERVEVRHVFLATLDHPSEEAKARLEAALAELTAGKKDFSTLAREISEDEGTKQAGGALGWMSRGRLPADFEAPVFALPLNKPTLVRTRLGWHLLEITGRKPAEPRSFDQAKPEVLAALRTMKREKALEDYRAALRKSEAGRIELMGAQ